MAKNKEQKAELINQYSDLLGQSNCLIVVEPNGLTPNETNNFRKELFEVDSKFHLVKNTLFKIALEKAGLPAIEELNHGSHAVLFCKEDYVGTSKLLKDFMKNAVTKADEPKISIVSAILDGALLSKDQVNELAEMPTIQGSVALILGILDQAIAGVANVLQDPMRSYVTIIDQAFKE